MAIASYESESGRRPPSTGDRVTRETALKPARATAALNLLGALQLPMLLLGVLVYVPFTVYAPAPGHHLLGGMFSGMTAWQIFFSTIAYVGASWTLMFIVGLLVEGAEARHLPERRGYLEHRAGAAAPTQGCLPAWSLDFFSVPTSWTQMLVFSALTLPGLAIMIFRGQDSWWLGVGAAAAGVSAAYLSTLVITAPVYAARNAEVAEGEPYLPLPDAWLAPRVWRAIDRWRRVGELAHAWRRSVSRVMARTPFDDVIERKSGLLHIDHFFAVVGAGSIFGLLLIGRWLFAPPVPKLGLPPLPSAALLFTLLILLIYVLGALTFHFVRFQISAVMTLLLGGLVSYVVTGHDHYYRATVARAAAVRVPALDVAGAHRGKNLVVVTATGGGIAAAAWTTLALTRLAEARPEVAGELRLISAVSGGAVGAAFLVDELERASADPPARRFERAYRRASRSSLHAVAYGLVFSDAPSYFSAGLLGAPESRGQLLESEWQFAAGRATAMPFGAFVPGIRAGRIPAVIFNATVMETGRRVMITPMQLTGSADSSRSQVTQLAGPPELPPRAQTLDEYLFADSESAAELSLWTAARLSATFPYITPAARAEPGLSQRLEGGHHLIDGGYYDNYGVASALEWLEPVLAARLSGQLAFERVAIVQIRVAHPLDPSEEEPANGGLAALAGPAIGVLNIRDGAAVTRNETELNRFIRAWNARLRPSPGVELRTFVLQPKAGEAYPLSWHLTAEQAGELERRWPRHDVPQPLAGELERLLEFLR